MRIILLILLPLLTFAQFNPERWQTVDTIYYQDQDGDENYLTISAGNTSGMFQIMPCSGILQCDTAAWAPVIRSKTYYLTIKATDASGLTVRKVAKVVLTKPRKYIVTMQ